ncbi:MAG: HPP family protein [Nannocystis sp.]|nr:HPP family protein [Nannocystis sp.]
MIGSRDAGDPRVNPPQRADGEAEAVGGAAPRPVLARLLARYPERPVRAVFMLVNSFVAIALLAGLAMVTANPFVFPSLGPTAFLCFFTPTAPSASPRSTIVGHAIGIVCGYGALLLVGLEHAPAAIVTGVDGARILAASLSLACTGALMIVLGVAHPPAGATTLIVSLGIVTRPAHLLILEAAVVVLTLYALAINRLLGVDERP